jgi:hypothetical protein
VQGIYWNAHPDRAAALAEIKKYCQNDVAVTMNVVLEWSGLPVVALDSIQRA